MKKKLLLEILIGTLEGRFEWFKNHKPTNMKECPIVSWEQRVFEFQQDMYTHVFNNPIYVGDSGLSDDECRHRLLDDLDVPR